jgi:3-hydroxyisobutyrate dehydrogenase-like beta-hydroxyacid dehydrogenase
MARVQVINEVKGDGTEWVLCLQWARYLYDDGHMEHGYRFIWRREDGSLQAARGQARIPSLRQAQELIKKAKAAGWGDYDADAIAEALRPGI